MFCNLFFERAPSLSEISLRLFPFICVVTPNCHRIFLVFLQFLCKFRHYPIIPTCFICYYSEFPDFAVVRIIPCILSVIFRRFPCFFEKNAVILSFQWFFHPSPFTNCFIFIQTHVIVPGYTGFIKGKAKQQAHRVLYIDFFMFFISPLFSLHKEIGSSQTDDPISFCNAVYSPWFSGSGLWSFRSSTT